MNKSLAFIFLGIAYAVALSWSWQNSTLSGLAGATAVGNTLVATTNAYTGNLSPSCRDDLGAWVEQTVRSRVAFEYPTGWAFAEQARDSLTRYAQGDCPKGSFLIAGRIAGDLTRSLREDSGLVRADILNWIW